MYQKTINKTRAAEAYSTLCVCVYCITLSNPLCLYVNTSIQSFAVTPLPVDKGDIKTSL